MSGAQGVSGERLSSLLGHVTHREFDDLVDPKSQGIAYPTGNPDLLITGPTFLYESASHARHVSLEQCESNLQYN
jgi:hypothetical protein